jgi:hypothetical protein
MRRNPTMTEAARAEILKRGREAVQKIREASKHNGLTNEEIDQEIQQARQERKARAGSRTSPRRH